LTALALQVLREFNCDIQPLFTSVDGKSATRRPCHLLIGSLTGAQSRLVVIFYNIRKVLQLFSTPVDELWRQDGVTYKTLVLDAENELFPSLDECMDFIGPSRSGNGIPGPDSTLVCCGTGIRRSAALVTAYLMYLDVDGGHSCSGAITALREQRPSIDIAGGSAEMVGGNGQGLIEALQLWEWCLVAQEAAGRQTLPELPEGEAPFSPTIKASSGGGGAGGEGSPGTSGKRKSPFLRGQEDQLGAELGAGGGEDQGDEQCEEHPESPGKRVRGVAEELDSFTL